MARLRLAKLPLGEVPDPGPLPHGSRMPLSQNPLFVGRKEKLKELAEKLKAAGGRPVTVAATGIGGVGKSQLASEFVHRYGRYFSGGVFWLSFADAAAVPGEVASCGGTGAMELRPDFGILSLEDQVREVMSAWQSALPRLLVFDNCEDEELLDRWRPPTGGCRMLLTSRREWRDPALGVEGLPLDVLRREESIALLRKHRPDLPGDDPDLNAIAGELGDLPLALHMAGGYLSRYRRPVTPAQYLTELRRPDLLRHRSLQESKGISPTRHEQNVARTFALSYDRLDASDPIDALAIKLLARAAIFALGEPVPVGLLGSSLNLPEDEPDAELEVEDALSKLIDLGMLEEEAAETLRMHRLVAAFVQDVVASEEARAAVEAALIGAISPLIDGGYPAPLLDLLPHLRAVTDAAREREDWQAALLCHRLGRCLRMIGAYREARRYRERDLEITERMLGEEHPETATSLGNLANLLRAQGDYEGAKPLYERALEIFERVLGEEHPYTRLVRRNLARLES